MTRAQYTRNCIQCGTEFHPYHPRQKNCSRECGYVSAQKLSDDVRFWAMVDQRGPDECWPRKGANQRGYGLFRIWGGRFPAARVAYELTHGNWPMQESGKPMLACHTCDNPPCCNPAHIFPGTNFDNNHDRSMKGRTAKGDQNGSRVHRERMPRGEHNTKAKFTEAQVIEIRRRFDQGGETKRGLAREYGVTHRAIFLIVKRLSWQHVA